MGMRRNVRENGCEKRLKDLDDLIDDPNAFSSLVTDEEWKILGADELNVETLA